MLAAIRLPRQNQDGWVKHTMTFHRKDKKTKPTGFATHFRLLGLKRGECRTHVIRSAAQAMSIALSDSEVRSFDDLGDRRRARIAFAAYKLLDPRERRDLYERVQLSYPLDRDDLDDQTIPGNALTRDMPKQPSPSSDATGSNPATGSASKVVLMSQPVIDEAIDAGDIEDSESLVEAELVDDDDNSSRMMERRGIVRLIRDLDRLEPRPLSALSWIRARLGI